MAPQTKLVEQDVAAPREVGELLSLQQAARLLKVHPNTLRNWERGGLIPVVRVGPRRDRRFAKDVLESFKNGERVMAAQVIPASRAEKREKTPPNVVANVPPTAGFRLSAKSVLIITAAIALLVLFVQIPTNSANQFAIRRNPPTVLFSDDFEAYDVGTLPRPIWNTIGIWTAERENGQRFLRGQGSSDNPLSILNHVYAGSSDWKDYRFKFTGRVISGQGEITALVDYLDENNYYAVKISATKARVDLIKEGESRLLGESPITLSQISGWHTYAVDLYGNDIDVLIDGDRVLGIANADLTEGKVGFVAQDQVVEFDHVQVLETPADARPSS